MFVNQIGYSWLRQKRVADAIRTFELNTTLYPASANVYDSLGDAYDAACRWPEARRSYEKAYGMARDVAGANTGAYKANLDRMTAKIAAGERCIPLGAGGAAPGAAGS
jgi:tetratricopeptide (TPR) repeat protein